MFNVLGGSLPNSQFPVRLQLEAVDSGLDAVAHCVGVHRLHVAIMHQHVAVDDNDPTSAGVALLTTCAECWSTA